MFSHHGRKETIVKRIVPVCVVCFTLLFSLSCIFVTVKTDPTPTLVSTATVPSPEPSVTPPSPEPTSTTLPTRRATKKPTFTQTPTEPTSTPLPTQLNDTGPYILYSGSTGIWISNPDGSFLTKISDLFIDNQDLHRAISPAGDRLAIVVSNDQGLDLMEIKIPSGETKLIAHILSITREEYASNNTSTKAFAFYALIGHYNTVAWQPGSGKILAFTAAINGPTADLYSYDTQTEKITQLTTGSSQAINPNWSPDGKYILHFGVSWVPPFGGAIGGANRLDGVWAVQISDGKVITLPKPVSVSGNFVGWQDDSHYLTYDSDEKCNSQNLRSVDIVSGKSTPVMGQSFYFQIVQSPVNKALLFAGADGCDTSPGEGIFLLPAGQTTPTKLGDKKAYEVSWLAESGLFQAYPEALFSSDGSLRYDPPVTENSFHPAVSINGYQAWEVIENFKGRVMLMVPGGKWQSILEDFSVDTLIWDPINGETLIIVLNEGSVYAASVPDFTPREIGNMGKGTNQAIWLP